ncbi:hypothetical protein HOE22_05470, partial [Candidatus Woesearchaeota archaeon]|nr:hypothetical protein [Candidatus Woesearchaeota archaeon]MBT4732867.1 hypothetical protein [Candidatus Woesearchaeota archaeon]MBT6050815.1 hypothetical protein [Candidatus Scalindua sp.]
MFSWFQKKNNQQSDSLNPKNLPEDLLVQALFENAILQAQNFVGRLRHGKQLSLEAQNKIASQIVEYAFAIMVFYLESAGKGGLKQKIMQKHEMFLMDNCGTNNSESRAQFLEAWRQEIKRKVQWLSLGNDTINLDNNCFAQSIISDPEFNVDMHNSELLPYIEQFVSDVVLSMKHFGIKNATLDFQKQFEIRDLPSAQSKIKAPSLDNNKLETSKKKREKNGWVWILFGLFCMYFIGMIVVFNDSKSSIPIHYKILGEMVELSGFVVPLLPLILIFTAAGVIPFLFFKKTRQWKMPVYIFLIISGWQYGGIMAGNFYLNFIEMKISNSRILAFGILFLYLTVFVSVPIITIQWLRNNKCKYILWLLPLAFLYVGLKINVQMHPMPDFNSTLKPHSLIHLEGGLRDRISKDVITLVKGNSDTKEITRDIEGVILSPAVSSTDADMIFKENSKAVVVVTAYDKKGNTIGLGSGFFVRADGAVVTNYHVIGMASDIKVTAGDKVLDVEGLIFSDEKNDLVILKAKARNMPVVKLGVVGKANIGE